MTLLKLPLSFAEPPPRATGMLTIVHKHSSVTTSRGEGEGGREKRQSLINAANFAIIFGQDCSCCVSPYNSPIMDFCISKTFSLDLKEPLSSIIISRTKTNANLYLSNAITELQFTLCRMRRFNRIRES